MLGFDRKNYTDSVSLYSLTNDSSIRGDIDINQKQIFSCYVNHDKLQSNGGLGNHE
jgi:hypothetical protein